MRIAIVGGSFDPIHKGHLQMGYQAIESLEVDQVWFMPAGNTPLKDRQLTSKEDRLEMVKRAIADEEKFSVCTIELEREGKSYTLDTLTELKKLYPEDEFYWIIGADQLKQFDKWRGADQLVQLAHFVCMDRDGEFGESVYDIQKIHMNPMPVSSSDIRVGNKLMYLPKSVLDYIYEKRLYVEDWVRTRMKLKRFEHSVSVAHVCEEFARNNGLDVQKAYYIGLFHDIAKHMDVRAQKQWMEAKFPEHLHYPMPVWHGFVGSQTIQHVFYIKDPDIIEAIYHHVLGTSTNPYAMMVFCADKCDPLRDYDSSPMIEACNRDLYTGFLWVKEENEKYLEKGN